MEADLLFTNAIVVSAPETVDGVFEGWLSVVDGRISDFGSGPSACSAKREIDCGGAPLFAGLVNSHAHSHSSLNRGATVGLGLDPWLAAIRAEQKVLTEDDTHVAALATYAELLAGGVTEVLDMCVHPRPAILAARQLGIRVVVAPFCADGIPFLPPLSATREFLEMDGGGDGRLTFAVSLHDLESASDKQIVEAFSLATEFDVPFHMHCAETPEWVERTRGRTGVSPIAHLEKLGVLSPRTSLAHAIWLDDEDINILAMTGAGVVHCPASNLSIGSGIAKVSELIDHGVAVALGTDGAKATQRLDMFAAMRLAAFVQRGQSGRADVVQPHTALRMAGMVGSAMLATATGAFRRGAPADLALLRADRLHLQPMASDVAATMLVQAADASDVRMTVVDGRVVYEDGVLMFGDMGRITASLGAVSEAVTRRTLHPPS